MKKTIIVIILAVYVASIAIVNFFGLEVKVFDGITYVSEIQCESITLHSEGSSEIGIAQLLGGVPLFIFDFTPAKDGKEYTSDDESILSNPNRIQINYEVLPHLADEAEVKFEFDSSNSDKVIYHETSRSFIFLKPNAIVTITIRAMDGSNVSTQVSIMGTIPTI